MSKLSQVITICFLLLIQYGYSLTLNKAFPWIDVKSPYIGQSLEEFETQFPDATKMFSGFDTKKTEERRQNSSFLLDNRPYVIFVGFTDGDVNSLIYGVTDPDKYEKNTRKNRSELKKLYGEPELLETGQVEGGVAHPIQVELYTIDGSKNIKAKLMSTSKGFHITLFDEAVLTAKGQPIVRSLEQVRENLKSDGITPKGDKTFIDYIAKLQTEEAGENADDSTAESEGVIVEKDTVSEALPSEGSSAPSAKKKFPTPLQIGGASAVIVVLAVVIAAKMRRPY